MLFKSFFCLFDQCIVVGQEEYLFDLVGFGQQFYDCCCCFGFVCFGCYYDQCRMFVVLQLAIGFFCKGFYNVLNVFYLIMVFGNFGIGLECMYILLVLLLVYKKLQFFLGQKVGNWVGIVEGVVLDLGIVVIGEKDDWVLFMYVFQVIGIKFCLMLFLIGFFVCVFGFNDCQWFIILALEDIVGIVLFCFVDCYGQAFYWVFLYIWCINILVGFLEQYIDEDFMGFFFVYWWWWQYVVCGFILGFDCLQGFQLCFQVGGFFFGLQLVVVFFLQFFYLFFYLQLYVF